MRGGLILAVEGKTGHERQALAIARRLMPCDVLRLPRRGRVAPLPSLADTALVIAAGRQAIAPARRIAALPAARPVVAVLQAVLWRPQMFDLVWAPAHDRVSARRGAASWLVETATAPSPLTPDDLAAGAAALAPRLACRPAPFVAVLVGGRSRTHRFGRLEAEEFATRLRAFARTHDASLLVATSPRTPPEAARLIAERLAGTPHLMFDWRTEPDPSRAYAAVLGAASAIIATADSIAMLSDAAATGKPIHGWRLPGGKAKYETFYAALEAHGAMRWFDGSFESWTYPPLDAAAVIADALAARLGLLADDGRRM